MLEMLRFRAYLRIALKVLSVPLFFGMMQKKTCPLRVKRSSQDFR